MLCNPKPVEIFDFIPYNKVLNYIDDVTMSRRSVIWALLFWVATTDRGLIMVVTWHFNSQPKMISLSIVPDRNSKRLGDYETYCLHDIQWLDYSWFILWGASEYNQNANYGGIISADKAFLHFGKMLQYME